MLFVNIWAASSEFVSSSIPSWQTLTAHAQPFRGARDLAFCLKVPLESLLVWASSGGSGETARMCRLAWTFAARIGYKNQIHLTRSICLRHTTVWQTVHAKIFLFLNHLYISWIWFKTVVLYGAKQTDGVLRYVKNRPYKGFWYGE